MLKKHLIILIVLFFLLFGLNLLINSFLSTPLLFTDLIISHVLLFVLYAAGIYLIHFVNGFDKTKVGITFLGLSVIKMLFALGYVVVQIQVNKKPNGLAINFVAIYFLYLIYLSYVTFSLLNLKQELKKG